MKGQDDDGFSDNPELAYVCLRYCCLIPHILISEATALFKTYYTFTELTKYPTFFLTAWSLTAGLKIFVEFLVGNIVHVITQMIETKIKENYGTFGKYCFKFLTFIGSKLIIVICLVTPYLYFCTLLFATIILNYQYWPIINITCTIGLVILFYGIIACCLPLMAQRMMEGEGVCCILCPFAAISPCTSVGFMGLTMTNVAVTIKTFFDMELIQNGVDIYPDIKYMVIPAMFIWIFFWITTLNMIKNFFVSKKENGDENKASCMLIVSDILNIIATLAFQLCPVFWAYIGFNNKELMWYGIGSGVVLYVSGVLKNWSMNQNNGTNIIGRAGTTGSINGL